MTVAKNTASAPASETAPYRGCPGRVPFSRDDLTITEPQSGSTVVVGSRGPSPRASVDSCAFILKAEADVAVAERPLPAHSTTDSDPIIVDEMATAFITKNTGRTAKLKGLKKLGLKAKKAFGSKN